MPAGAKVKIRGPLGVMTLHDDPARAAVLVASRRPWSGERGLVSEEIVRRFVGDATAPVYYVAGPPAMVEAMTGILTRTGVPEYDVRSEGFYGY